MEACHGLPQLVPIIEPYSVYDSPIGELVEKNPALEGINEEISVACHTDIKPYLVSERAQEFHGRRHSHTITVKT
eukprot:scaffold74439_cov33-Prasinocladus_malaysianus.AAC.4